MARRAPPKPPPRASATEWIAAGMGLALTLAVIGYTVWEGVTEDNGPPRLQVLSEPSEAIAGGFVVPIVVSNASHATAADVQVSGVLEDATGVVEARRTSFAYVPGRGTAEGGLIFRHNPASYRLRLDAEGYGKP